MSEIVVFAFKKINAALKQPCETVSITINIPLFGSVSWVGSVYSGFEDEHL